jgi:DNA-binding NtrC family response regulator
MPAREKIVHPLHVLIIEENVHHAELLTELLDQRFAPVVIHTVDTYEDGAEFLSLSSYDIVLSDSFVGSNAIEQYVDEMVENARGTPLIVITGRGDEALAARLTRKGVAEYLVKTQQTLEQLGDTIQYHLKKTKKTKHRNSTPSISHSIEGEVERELEHFREHVRNLVQKRTTPEMSELDSLSRQLAHIRTLASSLKK